MNSGNFLKARNVSNKYPRAHHIMQGGAGIRKPFFNFLQNKDRLGARIIHAGHPGRGQYNKAHVQQVYNDSPLYDIRTMIPEYKRLDTPCMPDISFAIFSYVFVGELKNELLYPGPFPNSKFLQEFLAGFQ